jgi:hypothetical protein
MGRVIPDLKLTFLIPLFGGLFPRSATETVHLRGIAAPHLTGRKTTRVLMHLAGFLSMLCSSVSSCVVLYPLSWRQGADHFLESVELHVIGDWSAYGLHAAALPSLVNSISIVGNRSLLDAT